MLNSHSVRRSRDVHLTVANVTDRIARRSRPSRQVYLDRIDRRGEQQRRGGRLRSLAGRANLAHGVAACGAEETGLLASRREAANVAIVSADGITQGRPGMEPSRFNRDVVALATAEAPAHETFDAALLLEVSDEVLPGLVTDALSFGHLPCLFVPAEPMPDQLVMEALGLHLPGAGFVPSGTVLRRALTEEAGRRIVALAAPEAHTPIGRVVGERALVNAIVAVLATGGSTNHTTHLVSMAAAAGIQLTWQDFAELSSVIPLLARIYPSGSADIDEFQQAGGTASLFAALLEVGLMHEDVLTVAGPGLARYCATPSLRDGTLTWGAAPAAGHANPAVLRGPERPFAPDGAIRVPEDSLRRAA